MKLVLHIGSHKAGSTAIQEYSFFNQGALSAAGVFYPLNLFKAYPRQHSELCLLLNDEAALGELLWRLVCDAQLAGAHTVFLSGEGLCVVTAEQLDCLKRGASRHFEQVEVILLVRNKQDYLLSSYKHALRYAPPLTEAAFLGEQRFSPRKAIDLWSACFPSGLAVWSYDDLKGDLVRLFFRRAFGVEVDGSQLSNESLDLLTLQIVNTLLKPIMDDGIAQILWNNSRKFPQKQSFPLDGALAKSLDQSYPDENWICEETRPFLEALLKKRDVDPTVDPVLACEKIIDLLQHVRAHLADKARAS